MPPHCDSMDGPVVTAAREALEARDVKRVLPYVKKEGEAEVSDAFARVMGARNGNPAGDQLADLWFFETVVRIHRAGEGAPFTGLKPAGLPVGPVVPVAERCVERGDATKLTDLLGAKLVAEIERRFGEVMERQARAGESVEAAREYVEAMLGLVVWSHEVYGCMERSAHDTGGAVDAHRAGHEHS